MGQQFRAILLLGCLEKISCEEEVNNESPKSLINSFLSGI